MVSDQEDNRPQPQPSDAAKSTNGVAAWRITAGCVLALLIALVLGGLALSITTPYLEPSRKDYTRAKLSAIDTALEDYNKRHHEYPPSLRVLTKREGDLPAYLDDDGIQDQWGREFVYERDNRAPNGGRPRVWSPGGKPGDPSSVISNW